MRQFEILEPRMSRGGIIAFEDVDFPRPGARMREAWHAIAARDHVSAAVEVGGRLGRVELA